MASKPAAKSSKQAAPKRSSTKAAAKPAKAAARKRSSTKAAITKPVAAAKVSSPIKMVASDPKADAGRGASEEINKRELVERVVAQSGMKKGDARRSVDAVLTALRDALAEGKDVAAAPLGKIKIVRKKQTPNGELAVLRVKLKDPDKAGNPTLGSDGVAKAQK